MLTSINLILSSSNVRMPHYGFFEVSSRNPDENVERFKEEVRDYVESNGNGWTWDREDDTIEWEETSESNDCLHSRCDFLRSLIVELIEPNKFFLNGKCTYCHDTDDIGYILIKDNKIMRRYVFEYTDMKTDILYEPKLVKDEECGEDEEPKRKKMKI
jgi:hypothetical protein